MRTLIYITLILCNFPSLAAISKWISFSQSNGHITIPVTVEGIETHAILDTGAQIHAINTAFILKNKLDLTATGKTRVKGVYGTEDKKTYNQVELSLFGFDTQIDGLVAAQLGFHTSGILLGAGFFDKFIVQIDYPNSRIRLITRDSLDLGELENIEMRAQRGTGRPIVKVALGEERSAWLLLDTGSNGGLTIKRSVADRLGWLDNKKLSSEISRGVNTLATTNSLRIDEFKFGPYTLENVLVSVPGEGQSANLEDQFSTTGTRIKSAKVEGILGYDILKHFVVTIDYKFGHAHIGLPEQG
ncbi:retroviral-like aspartic protease family protein [Pseudoalteromonas sp. YIC-827]|uniref:Retroviral-like aspartic protease family protein n=1 Tax=Pseudoalteromonas qingdaonensis TaxID=3131913 RepID=A0ABU9MZA1_9GAMM